MEATLLNNSQDTINSGASCSSVMSTSSTSAISALNENDSIMHKIENCPYLDGQFFKVIGDITDIKHLSTQCQLCLPKNTIIKGGFGISTNFVKHIKMHSSLIPAYNKYKESKKIITIRRTDECTAFTDKPIRNQPNIRSSFLKT